MPSRVWLHPSVFLGGVVYGITHEPMDESPAWRPYEMLEHAERKLASPTEHDRVDALLTMRRCVDVRVRLLHKYYAIKSLPIASLPKGRLEQLEFVGLGRALVLHRLRRLRNAIEHEDLPPPSAEDCLELAEVVWYFLRSTDRPASARLTEIELAGDSEFGSCGMTVEFDPPCLLPRVTRATLATSLVSDRARRGWAVIRKADLQSGPVPHWGVSHEEVLIEGGQLVGPAEVVTALTRRYFELVQRN